MQTFLAYPSFSASAVVLDRQRLGCQRKETIQLLEALAGIKRGWANHPACKMWRGHEGALAEYGVTICLEWRRRKYNDACLERIQALGDSFGRDACDMPPWLGDDRVHSSHRAALLGKLPSHYGQFGWTEAPMDVTLKPLPYFWPVQG